MHRISVCEQRPYAKLHRVSVHEQRPLAKLHRVSVHEQQSLAKLHRTNVCEQQSLANCIGLVFANDGLLQNCIGLMFANKTQRQHSRSTSPRRDPCCGSCANVCRQSLAWVAFVANAPPMQFCKRLLFVNIDRKTVFNMAVKVVGAFASNAPLCAT